MMMVCRRRSGINVQETIGMCEFALVPRSMFAADGSMLRCSAKSALMAILEKLPSRSADQRSISDGTTTNAAQSHLKVIIIDGMAELQCLDKPEWVKNCEQLAIHFVDTIEQKYSRKADFWSVWLTHVVKRSHQREKARRTGSHLLSNHRFHQHLKSFDEEASVAYEDEDGTHHLPRRQSIQALQGTEWSAISCCMGQWM